MSSFAGLEAIRAHRIRDYRTLTGRRAHEDIPGIDAAPVNIPQAIAPSASSSQKMDLRLFHFRSADILTSFGRTTPRLASNRRLGRKRHGPTLV